MGGRPNRSWEQITTPHCSWHRRKDFPLICKSKKQVEAPSELKGGGGRRHQWRTRKRRRRRRHILKVPKFCETLGERKGSPPTHIQNSSSLFPLYTGKFSHDPSPAAHYSQGWTRIVRLHFIHEHEEHSLIQVS